MWEFSFTLNINNIDAFKFAQKKLSVIVKELDGIITSYSSGEYLTIVVACNDADRIQLQYCLSNIITLIIGNFFKEKFLAKYLKIPYKDNINFCALLRALVNFDKETDVVLIKKYLTLDTNLFLESFFDFKLISLKSKWLELAKLANDNSTYLICEEVCIELLRFLVDNLEICCDQVNIVCEQERYKILDSNFNEINYEFLSEEDSDNAFISNIITLCPKNINLYYQNNELATKPMDLVLKIFNNRVKVLSPDKICKNV